MASKNKKKSRRKKKQEEFEEKLFESDETFAFIAGYTSGGFAYGITWEEMEATGERDKASIGKEHYNHDEKEIDLPFD